MHVHVVIEFNELRSCKSPLNDAIHVIRLFDKIGREEVLFGGGASRCDGNVLVVFYQGGVAGHGRSGCMASTVAPPLAERAGKKHGIKNVAGILYSETVHAKCLLR